MEVWFIARELARKWIGWRRPRIAALAPMDQDDLVQELMMLAVKEWRSLEEQQRLDRSRFGGYAFRAFGRWYAREATKAARRRDGLKALAEVGACQELIELQERELDRYALRAGMAFLSEIERSVLQQVYGERRTVAEVAALEGVCARTIFRKKRSGLERLRLVMSESRN